MNVDLDRITVSEVSKAPFQESIPQNGTVLPLTTIYLVTTDGGRVETRYVEDGAIMKAGDPILKLANTDLELNMSNAATSVSQMLATMQYAEVQAAQNTVNKQNSLAAMQLQFSEAERIYNLDKRLFSQHAIGSQEMA